MNVPVAVTPVNSSKTVTEYLPAVAIEIWFVSDLKELMLSYVQAADRMAGWDSGPFMLARIWQDSPAFAVPSDIDPNQVKATVTSFLPLYCRSWKRVGPT